MIMKPKSEDSYLRTDEHWTLSKALSTGEKKNCPSISITSYNLLIIGLFILIMDLLCVRETCASIFNEEIIIFH